MRFEFSRVWILTLIPVGLILIFIMARDLKINRFRKRIMLFLRGTIITFLILALSGVGIVWKARNTTTIFLADLSDSLKSEKNKVDSFIRESIKYKNSEDSIGVIAFGKNALVDSFVSENISFSDIETEPKGINTNFENALSSVLSIIPENTKKRIVLISDGEENEGNVQNIAPLLIEQGIDFKVKKLEKNLGEEVSVEGIDVPQNLRIGQEFNVVVNINSTVNTEANISLFSGNEKKLTDRIKLNKGENKFVFKDSASVSGFKSYEVRIDPDTDSTVKNNSVSAFTNVNDKPRILVIQDKEGEADEIINMLKASGIEYDLHKSGSAPSTIENLSKYKSIITCNVSAENLNDKFLNLLEPYVKDLGGGFVAIGGDNSFALGGYYKTSLETILPVYMDLRGRKEIPSMALNLVIDKSGSMSGSKLALAKEAAARTLDALRDKDEIGVLTFDDSQYWVVERQKIKDKESLRNDIGTIREGGGTSILPALQEAYESLKKSNAKIKHIILLTDGQAERSGYDELIDQMNKEGITISTVAVGRDSDILLLENIAETGKGRYYYTDEGGNIPRIFAKETFMASRTYLNNEEFTPAIESFHSVLSGAADNGLPNLMGYIGASPKNTAKVVLKSSEEDPILSMWRYGLGKTVAWNSDMNGKWSSNYIGWENNLKLWQNIINWTIDNYEDSNASMEVNIEGTSAKINFKTEEMDKVLDTEVEILTPSMEKKKVKLYPSTPGEYTGEFNLDNTGVYILKGIQKDEGEIVNAATGGVNLPYSPEYKITKTSKVLEDLVQGVDGNFIDKPQEVFQGDIKGVQGRRDLTYILLILALSLFILDIAFRRLNLPLGKLQEKLNTIKLANTENKVSKNNKKEKIVRNKSFETTNKKIEESKEMEETKEIKESKSKVKKKEEKKELLNTSALLNSKKKK